MSYEISDEELREILFEHGPYTTNEICTECSRGCASYPCPTRRLVLSVMEGRLIPRERLERNRVPIEAVRMLANLANEQGLKNDELSPWFYPSIQHGGDLQAVPVEEEDSE